MSTTARSTAALAAEPRCHCGADGVFGYRRHDGVLEWFCAEHRLRQWSADACSCEAESARVAAELLRKEAATAAPSAPDLQELVRVHGGYDKISAEAWAEFDRAMEEWQASRRDELRRR